MSKQFIHIVARSFYPHEPFKNRTQCIWMWQILQKVYPNTVAAILMPNHLHLLTVTEQPKEECRRLSRVIGHFTRIFCPNNNIWQPVGAPELIPDRLYLQRTIRYIHLNPCRKKIIDDPLKWEFSTHRDWLGLSYPSWISDAKQKSIFRPFSPESFHSYVSSDPSCSVKGTPLPLALYHNKNSKQNQTLHLDYSEIPLKWIFRSALIAQHAHVSALSRKGIVRTVAVQSALESELFYPA